MRTEPYKRDKEEDMNLPQGKTCGDCFAFTRFCQPVVDRIEADEVCDWAPSRFKEKPKPQAAINQEATCPH